MIVKILLLVFLVEGTIACSRTGACGGCCGGCRARARARAAKTNTITDYTEETDEHDGNIFGLRIWNRTDIVVTEDNVQKLTNPNFLFRECCVERKLPSACVQKCHFNEFNKNVLESMFVGTDECPFEFLPEMQFCAAQGTDHSRCCSTRGVADTTAGDKCLTFCDQRPDLYTPIDYSYAPCFDRFDDMKRCFYDEVRSSAQRKFLPMISKPTMRRIPTVNQN